MQYLLLIYRNEAQLVNMTPADRQAMSAEYGTYRSRSSRAAISRPATGFSRPRRPRPCGCVRARP